MAAMASAVAERSAESAGARIAEGSSAKARSLYTDIAVRSLTCHTATGTRMPYRITKYYLPPDRGDIPAFTAAEAGT